MKKPLFLRTWATALGVLWLMAFGCSAVRSTQRPLPVVPEVDLERYAGVWHEIARYPHRFQKGCINSKATYTIRPDGKIEVLNECENPAEGGRIDSARGTAWVVDSTTNAKLKVSFFWPFRGDYWIIDLGENYEYAVVGTPTREYLWILARTPFLPADRYQRILERVAALGFDPARLILATAMED